MTYIPTEYDETASTFNRPGESGAREWQTFRVVRGDHVNMYDLRKKRTHIGPNDDASHETLDELLEDAYL